MAVRVSVNNDFSISRFPVKVDNEDNAYYVNLFTKKTPERRLFLMFSVNYKQVHCIWIGFCLRTLQLNATGSPPFL